MEKIDLGGNALSGQMVWNKLFDWKKKKEGWAPFFFMAVLGRMYALLLAGANAGEPHLIARWLKKLFDGKKKKEGWAPFFLCL